MSGAADALRRARGALTDRAFIVFLLVSLTAVWFVGLVVPQRLLVDPAQWEAWRAASPRLVRILEVSGASDVYRAPGTYVLLGFFFLSLCAALWDRLPRLFRRTRLDHGLPLEIAALSRRAGTISIGTADPDRSVASACALLEAEGYSVFVPAPGRARAIRFRHAPLGFVLFHGSFLLLLAGAIVLHATRFSGMATVAEGEEFETAAGPYSARPQQARFGRPRPSLVFTVLEVRPRSRAGHPVSLQVELLVRGDAEPRVADVNEPVTLGPTSLLVMGAGAAPLFACEAGGVGERMYVKLVPDREGRTRFLLDACGLEILARPALPPERESRGQGVMLATAGSANLEGLATAGIEVAVRGLDGWTSRGVLRPGDALASPNGKQILRMPEVRYYASLQVVDERGGWLLWAGFLVGTAGLVMRLLLFRREVVVVADPDGGRVLAGAAADVAGWRADDLLDRIAGRAAGPAGEAPRVEAVVLVATFFLYAAAFALSVGGLVSGRERAYRAGRWAALAGLGAHTLAIGARTVVAGHFPIVTPYENASVGAWSIVVLTFLAPSRLALFRAAGAGAVALALLILGWAVTEDAAVTPFVASVRSTWLYVHVTFAFLAYGAFSIASGASLAYLVRARRGGPAWLPSLEQLDRTAYLYVVFGFITCAVMIGAGSIWAKDLWGSYWSWDPVETWNLVAWLAYGVLIHLRVTYGWRDARFAWFAMFAVLLIVVAYFGVGLLLEGTQHLFTVPTASGS